MSTSLLSQLTKLRKEKELIEKKERALLSKTNSQALTQIKLIMKESGLTLDALIAGLSGQASKAKVLSSKSAASKKASISKKSKSKGGSKPRASLAGIKVPIKYKHPTQPELTWTGRGKTPAWMAELKKAGKLDAAKVE